MHFKKTLNPVKPKASLIPYEALFTGADRDFTGAELGKVAEGLWVCNALLVVFLLPPSKSTMINKGALLFLKDFTRHLHHQNP